MNRTHDPVSELRRVYLFAEMADEHLKTLIGGMQEIQLAAGGVAPVQDLAVRILRGKPFKRGVFPERAVIRLPQRLPAPEKAHEAGDGHIPSEAE